MKKIIISIAVTAVGAICLLSLCACNSVVPYRYDDAGEYTAGGGELPAETVTSIDADWVSGSVEIIADENATTVSFYEESGETEEKYLMHYRLDGGTLKIKYVKSGTKLKNMMNKTLFVRTPKKTFTEIKADSVSGEVNLENCSASAIDVDSVSGGVKLTNCRASETDADSGSGRVSLNGCETDRLRIDSTSGGVTVRGGRIANAEIDTTSGAITVADVSGLAFFEANTLSGGVTLRTPDAPSSTDIDATSGSVELIFGAGASFTLSYDTISGSLSNRFEATVNGDAYVVGGGAARVGVETVSGSLRIEKSEQ